MSEVSMMPLSLAPKRPAEEVHLTDSAAGLQRNAAKLLESYKSRREDSVGGSDPSSSPHPEDSELDEEVDMPAIDSHQPFPCVWLNSSNGLPLTISPIEPDSKYVVIEPTDPGAAEGEGKTETPEKTPTEQPACTEAPAVKAEAVPPTPESHPANGHFPAEGSEADPAPPTNNGSTPPPISKTASVAEALGTPLRSPTMTSSQPATPTQSMANIANSMGQSIFPLSEGQAAGSPLMNSKMLSNVCNKVLSDVQGIQSMNGMRTPTTTIDENGENLEVCPECHKVFKRKVYLQRHMEREHWSTAKVFKCDDCSYETKHQSNLSVHRRIHTGERPYHCGACGQRYTQGHLLKSHIRSRHGGNMELYNLEKKSDSTRGRKSLDAKHDNNMSPFIKQEKINNLVQQLEQQKLQHMMASPTMSHFMNNMSYINHLRPLMTNPLALSNNLLAGGSPNPRMLLGNMQNGLNNSMMSLQQNLSLMVNQSIGMGGMNQPAAGMSPIYTSSPISTTSTPTEANGIKLPLKIPEMQAQNGNAGQRVANLSFSSNTSPTSTGPTSMDWQDQSGPQDLTVKKSGTQGQVSPSSRSSQSSSSYQPMTNGTATEGSTGSQRDSPVPDDLKTLHAEVSKGLKRPCEDENCAHAKKLKLLRKNIVRMLSVLTPDLSMDAGLNYDSDQVDELLHEVIYSNMEDIMDESSRKT